MSGQRKARGLAFAGLARLSAKSTASQHHADPGLASLCSQVDCTTSNGTPSGTASESTDTTAIPMPFREFDILLALCKAAPYVQQESQALLLLEKLAPYIPESCSQSLPSSPFYRALQSSPWETLSFELVTAVLDLGWRFHTLRASASHALSRYLGNCLVLTHKTIKAGPEGTRWSLESGAIPRLWDTVILITSLLGFLRASATKIEFWTPDERLELLDSLHTMLSQGFLLSAESALSTIRNSRAASSQDLKHLVRQSTSAGRPLGALVLRQEFAGVLESCAALLVVTPKSAKHPGVLEALLSKNNDRKNVQHWNMVLSEKIADLAEEEVAISDEGSEYLRLESAGQRARVHAVKASSLTSFLCCSLVHEDAAEPDLLMAWLESTLADTSQVADENLACTSLRCMTILAQSSSQIAVALSRSLPRFLIRGPMTADVSRTAAECLLAVLRLVSHDTVITTLYGLGNALTGGRDLDRNSGYNLFMDANSDSANDHMANGHLETKSSTSLAPSDSEKGLRNYGAVILAIVTVARGIDDPKITALALSMLVQKVGKGSSAVDLKITTEAAVLAAESGAPEFRSLLRLYNRLSYDGIHHRNDSILSAVTEARVALSQTLKGGSRLYEIFLRHLLEAVVGEGESQEVELERAKADIFAAQEVALVLRPLALLVSNNIATEDIGDIESFPAMQREAWFNVVIHGFSLNSALGKQHLSELSMLARYSQPLIAEELADRVESDIELNVVLRRGMSSEALSQHKKEMIHALPRAESEIKGLSYPEVIFLQATYLLETLRATSGNCSQILAYFADSQFQRSLIGNCIAAVAVNATDRYIDKVLAGNQEEFSAPFVAEQLSKMFEGCCHRSRKAQDVSYQCAERIISQIPASLCQRSSLFTLLDLLTVMWTSCLDADIDEYEWKSTYKSASGATSVYLSDDFELRKDILRRLRVSAQNWIEKALNTAALDVKGLLQTYLSETGEGETIGHMSFGRSIALQMGSAIPATDQRLQSIEGELNINTASDFVSQYTIRQEYRFADPLQFESNFASAQALPKTRPNPEKSIQTALQAIYSRLDNSEKISWGEVRNELRSAASFLCRAHQDSCTIFSLFVKIPFKVFTKQSIKFGLSLWLGVINENPRTEPRLLTEIIENWINTIDLKLGLFNLDMKHVEPFYLKEEFAPSDRDGIAKYQQRAHDALTPHFRIFQFLSSHHNATRLSSPSTEKSYLRLMKASLRIMRHTQSHPLARELHFYMILIGLRVLRYSVNLDDATRWRLKDEILSAALGWFAHPPRWSFGGNRLQIKAETHLLADVQVALYNIGAIGSLGSGANASLQSKQELLTLLITNEQTRLMVWLFPLDHRKRHYFTAGPNGKAPSEESLSFLLDTAWAEKPAVAIHLASRFHSKRLDEQIRLLVLRSPYLSLKEPEALRLMLGSELPGDVATQLRYLMIWAPVDPISSVIYFLPAFKNHPLVIQYAVKALESHSVDVTFFYVPQIVQTLRYDALGYVERYIIETAKFSQLFAHQIIWNMKANSYKDEDSQEPDPMKPTLDKVMESLISSFVAEDKTFYEREFAFFDEITGVSGTLRPFLKKSKPEKKQKIEDELRKIQIDVGVYLPSNPEGVVVGIDRKSGKPLQSHAKTPYMATFRIRKERQEDTQDLQQDQSLINGSAAETKTFEIWQSAIFKVGDDCRQDILALQMIAAFRGIFQHVGLPVYVFPYRVTATNPGCGVVDVLPRSISRDMLGREAVNGLYEWFVSRFGGESSPEFQAARANFVKSMAAYSITSYLLQFKDRHNGNIMFDDDGHVLHIDFGFCFDIAPGGVRFERAPFKLTKEMVAVMGGGPDTQSFRWFEELCIKAFLASRQHVDTLAHMVVCMLDSGLPCFKPESIQHFRERFVLEKSERDAADFVRFLIRKSYANYSTKVYDQFQLATNGIPY